jgi:hypothetical protein
MDKKLDQLLKEYINNPEDPKSNLLLALHYNKINQTAAAISFFLRTAERTRNKELQYECMLKAASCFESQSMRSVSVKGLLQHAIAILPRRPEAYLALALIQETTDHKSNWIDSYQTSSQALEFCNFGLPPLKFTEFPGKFALYFQKGHTAYWTGLCDESREIFTDLYFNWQSEMNDFYRELVYNNMINLGLLKKKKEKKFYDLTKLDKLKHKFVNSDKINKNYSEAYQDMFVLSMLDGKKQGTYLEIGSCRPFKGNNTALLETQFDWIGISIDIEESFVQQFKQERKNLCLKGDATAVDWALILELNNFTKTIDYLQIDCEPPNTSLKALFNIPFDKYQFKVITFEHDYYTDQHSGVREKSREFLRSKGYTLVVNDISPDQGRPFEDWWVKADLVDSDILNKMTCLTNEENVAEDYMLSSPQVDIIPRKVGYVHKKKGIKDAWKHSIAPTMEFTTVIPPKGCVVDCVFCPQQTLLQVYEGVKTLTLDNFKRIVDKIPQEVRITFAGFTEPWLNKSCTDMLLYAHETGHPVSAFTTVVGMDKTDVERIKDIPFAGAPNGGFTIHLPDQERKAKHPITKKYIETIEYLAEVKDQIKNFQIMSMGTVHDDVKHAFPSAPQYDMWSRAGNLIGEAALKPEVALYTFKSIDHGNKAMTCGCDERMYHNVCLPNGDIALCCMDYGLEHIIGNIFESSYEEVIPEPHACYEMCRKCENGIDFFDPSMVEERKIINVN